MAQDFDPAYGHKRDFYITYKDLTGKESLVKEDGFSKSQVEHSILKTIGSQHEIVKTQTCEEWIAEAAPAWLKNVKKLEDLQDFG
jgi:hypothetical protein